MLFDLATSVRGKRISAVELVGSSIDQIERVNPSLNAVVALRAEEALEEAASVDRRVSAGDTLGPLAGIPFLVKDTENTAGMQTTYGSLLFADTQPALRDDLGARRLKAAGAIVLGKTNMPEFAFEGYTDNRLFGPTRNPWGTDWSPGGSSGGSAAALAAGMSPVATASDGGGLDPDTCRTLRAGGPQTHDGRHRERPDPPWMDLSSDGPLGCSVEDVRLLLSVVSGPVAGDLMALPIRPFQADRLPTRALALRRFVGYGPLPEAVDLMFGQALRSLADLGISVDIIDPPFSPRESNVDRDWRRLSSVEQLTWLSRGKVQANLNRFHPGFRATMEDALTVSLDEYLAARRRRFQYVRVLDELLADDTVIISPTLCEEGWFADGVTPRISVSRSPDQGAGMTSSCRSPRPGK